MSDPPSASAAALAAVRSRAIAAQAGDRRLDAVADADTIIETIATHARITLNFHPDRLLADGRTVAESLAADGIYRAQYETGVTSGSRTAYLRGDRDNWEHRLFGPEHYTIVTPAQRPKYGALNIANHPDGAAARFGSAHVRLRPEAGRRATFTVGDSYLGPADVGTIDEFRTVLGGFLHRPTATGSELDLLRVLGSGAPPTENGRCLDDYIEAQVHGVVNLAADAEAIVLDPSFRGSDIEALIGRLAERSGIELDWHHGYRLAAEAVPAAFRGPEIPPFAAAIGARFGDGRLDARIIGRLRPTSSMIRVPGTDGVRRMIFCST